MRASRKGGVAISPFLSLRGFPKGSRGNLYIGLLRRFAARRDNAVDGELEKVSKVMEVYKILIKFQDFLTIKKEVFKNEALPPLLQARQNGERFRSLELRRPLKYRPQRNQQNNRQDNRKKYLFERKRRKKEEEDILIF